VDDSVLGGGSVDYALGVDLGTTYTAAAVRVQGRVQIVRLGSRRAEIPSLVFVRDDGVTLVGDAAERRGAEEPGRLAREFKRRLGDPVPLLVGGVPFSAHALMAKLLDHVYQTVVRQQEATPSAVSVTHPANWGPYKRELMMQAMRMAGLPQVELRPEPEAAAVQYAAQERLRPGEIVAVYDLGGGTFDAAVLRKTADGFEVLGEPAGIEQLGGVDFDEAVFGHVVETMGSRAEDLDPQDPAVQAALVQLRRECVTAKEDLSDDTEVMVPVALPAWHTRIRLNRSEFEAMIRPTLAETAQAMHRALSSAGVRPDDLRAIVLAGGSSRIPLVSELLSTEFGRPVVLDGDPAQNVALGAALAVGVAAAHRVPAAQMSTAAAPAAATAPAAPPTVEIVTNPAPLPPPPPGFAPMDRPVEPQQPPVRRRPSGWVLAAGAAAATVLLVVGVAWVLLANRGDEAAAGGGWQRLADLPVPVDSAAVAAYQGKVWVAGGLTDSGGTKLSTTYVYDPKTDKWSDGPRLPRPISHAALVATPWNLYFLSGWVQAGGSKQVLKLSPDQRSWVQDVDLPENRVDGAAAFDGTGIIFAGGSRPGGSASDAVFSLRDGKWTQIGTLSAPRQKLSAATNNVDTVWFLGGRRIDTDVTYGNIDRVTSAQLVPAAPGAQAPIDPPTDSGAAVFVDGSGMCLVGGKSQGNQFQSWWCDQPRAAAKLPRLDPPRAGLGVAKIGRTVYLVGGYTAAAQGTTQVEAYTPPAG
jgi:actin-like ATPase involved in cell morphogenesis